MGSVSASHAVGSGFATPASNGTDCLPVLQARMQELIVHTDCLKGRVEFGTVYGDMHLSYTGTNRKDMVLYPGAVFLVLNGLRYRKSTIMD